MNRKFLFGLGIGGAVLLVAFVVVMVVMCNSNTAGNTKGVNSGINAETIRQNTIDLAMDYLAAGEYQRALDLLESLLINNPNDTQVRSLLEKVLYEQRLANEAR